MKTTGRNPNTVKKEMAAAEITLGQAFAVYRLKNLGWEPHQKPGSEDVPTPSKTIAKPNSIVAFDKAVRKLSGWGNTRIRDIDADMVVKRFKEISNPYVTSAEQTFRWANRATVVAIEREEAEANRLKREPTLTYNPFVAVRKLYRSKPQLEEVYTQKGIRSPLTEQETLGKFLNALWHRRKENRTGGDYLLCSVLWGTRKSEPSQLAWWDRITKEEGLITSHVNLDTRILFFYDTKNRYNLSLPICDGAFEILKQRHENRDEFNKWVFPARSNKSKTGQYSDSRSLIKYICEDAGIPFVANHNFRRTFATIANELVSMSTLKYLMNHKDGSNVTNIYIKKEYERVMEALQRIELHLLTTSPTIYNAILTPKYPPMAET
jgi:integrase